MWMFHNLSVCVHTWKTGCSYMAISWRSATLPLHLAQLSRAYLNARCPGMVDARPAHSGRVTWEVSSTITKWIFSRQERSSGPTNLLWDFTPISLYKVALLWQSIVPLLQSELFSPQEPWVPFRIPFNKHVEMYLVSCSGSIFPRDRSPKYATIQSKNPGGPRFC